MASLEAERMKMLAVLNAEGLSHDAVRSLSDLAESLEHPGKSLEAILASIDSNDRGELAKVRRMKKAIENGPFLD